MTHLLPGRADEGRTLLPARRHVACDVPDRWQQPHGQCARTPACVRSGRADAGDTNQFPAMSGAGLLTHCRRPESRRGQATARSVRPAGAPPGSDEPDASSDRHSAYRLDVPEMATCIRTGRRSAPRSVGVKQDAGVVGKEQQDDAPSAPARARQLAMSASRMRRVHRYAGRCVSPGS